MPFFYGPYGIVVLPAIILALYAQFKVQATFQRYLQVRAQNGMTGADVARMLLRKQGLEGVRVESVPGRLTDHYDPRDRTVRLSQQVFHGNSLAAIGVAAHETGHALQHATDYVPLSVRSSLVPVANVGSQLGLPLALFGYIFQSGFMLQFGIMLFSLAVLFQLVTLPVEFNASSRALRLLAGQGVLAASEIGGAKAVLSAAALTYVAATLSAVLQLLRLLLMAGLGRRRN
ncbi:MAG TPA: zinc metallopeptidase [bacterium]|jgi:Zn-dependent membrane protease YugP|nr:zinc metallopeptidase [bacterium]